MCFLCNLKAHWNNIYLCWKPQPSRENEFLPLFLPLNYFCSYFHEFIILLFDLGENELLIAYRVLQIQSSKDKEKRVRI